MQRSLANTLADTLADGGWRARARAAQMAPSGAWFGWLILAGRGWGKSLTGTGFICEEIETQSARNIAIVAPTAADLRDVIVEGPSGILANASAWCRPDYEASKRRLTWPCGAIATLFSAEEPDRLRGPQFDLAWLDEFAAYPDPQAIWDQVSFGLRMGHRPRVLITTTPRPLKILKSMLARGDFVVTRGSTFENEANLPTSFLESMRARYENTRLGRQELNAELLEEVQGALWTRAMIDAAQMNGAVLPEMRRVVVAVDPSGTRGASDDGDKIGIVVAGEGVDGKGYILADRTCKESPAVWGRRAVAAYHEFKADRIVAKKNFGGAMVEHVIRTVDPRVPYREVVASRGKVARAEPVAALYEQNKIRHAAPFPELEDQLCAMTGDGFQGEGSPDVCDSAVWAITELMLGQTTPPPIFGRFTWG